MFYEIPCCSTGIVTLFLILQTFSLIYYSTILSCILLSFITLVFTFVIWSKNKNSPCLGLDSETFLTMQVNEREIFPINF